MRTSQANTETTIPLVVGAAGHRDLRAEDAPRLEAEVKQLFQQLQQAYPATPLLVLSPLAEGSDRLLARVGLACGARLIAVLPFPREDYSRDFTTAESKEEFAELMARADSDLVVPLAEGNTLEEIRSEGEPRNRQYAAAGVFTARHCHLLVALWDGDRTEKTGSTSQLVRMQLTGLPGPAPDCNASLATLETGPVYHISTPHSKRLVPLEDPFAATRPTGYFFGQGELEESLRGAWKHLDQFNRDVQRLVQRSGNALRQTQSELLPDELVSGLPSGFRQIREYYSLADLLAVRYLGWRRRAWRTLCVLGVIGVLVLASGDTVVQQEAAKAAVLAAYLSVLGIGFLLLRWAEGWKRDDVTGFRNRHLDYRALAEGLRVQFFWRLAGLSDEVADHYLRKQRAELEWIRQAIRVCDLLGSANTGSAGVPPGDSQAKVVTRGSLKNASAPAGLPGLPVFPARFDQVYKHWVQDQASYFVRARHRNMMKRARLRALSSSFFVVGFVLVLVSLADHILRAANSDFQRFMPHEYGGLMKAAALAVFGALEVYAKKMAFAEESKQYELMARLFRQATLRFQSALAAGAQTQLREVARDLGCEALSENGDWVLLHRERPMEVRLG